MIQVIQQQFRSGSQNRVILLALLLALLLLNLPSSGYVRFGPGAGDEGSGLGGTGRSPIPGSESGLGGTGFRPFVGYSDNAASSTSSEQGVGEITAPAVTVYHQPTERELAVSNSVVLDIPAQRSVSAAPVPSPRKALRTDDYTRDSSAILINEQIQQDIDSNALFFTQLDAQSEFGVSTRPKSNFVVSENPVNAVAADDGPSTESRGSDEVSWLALSNYLADQHDALSEEKNGSSLAALTGEQDNDDERLQRPDRVQRPELPTMQRVRPVQRAGVLPPRIKPLKL